jgi:hypothetical protein
MKALIIFTILFIALFSFSGCAVMGALVITLIESPPPLPPPPDDDLQIIIIDHPTSTPPDSYKRRETRTGRGSLNSNPAPSRNNESNKETRDSGIQRSRQTDSSPAPVRNNEDNTGTRTSGMQRGKR